MAQQPQKQQKPEEIAGKMLFQELPRVINQAGISF